MKRNALGRINDDSTESLPNIGRPGLIRKERKNNESPEASTIEADMKMRASNLRQAFRSRYEEQVKPACEYLVR